MARYGKKKYSTFKYGSETEAGLSWGLEIDWDNDGVYTGENEGFNLTKLITKRGRKYLIDSNGTGFQPIPKGEMQAYLNNLDGRYDAYNTSSPLYPYILPGCKYKLTVKDNATNTLYNVMVGRIKDIQPVYNGYDQIVITGEDEFSILEEDTPSVALQLSTDPSTAISDILTDINWTAGTRLDHSTDILPYWWTTGKTALAEIQELSRASLGTFFIGQDGYAVWHSRAHIGDVVETLDETKIQLGISLPQPWEAVRNTINASVNSRTLGSTSELWRLGDKPSVGAGATLTVWANFTANSLSVPAKDVVDPVATTDYTMNTASDGTGTDRTGNFTVTTTVFSSTAKIELKNNSAGVAYITLLKIRGKPITPDNPTQLQAINSTSVTRYRTRSLTMNSPWMQSTNIASDLVTFLSSFLGDAKGFPTVRLEAIPEYQFTPELFDRVALNFPSVTISGVYNLAYAEHEWMSPIGNLARTTFVFEPAPDISADYWTFPTEIGVTSIFGF